MINLPTITSELRRTAEAAPRVSDEQVARDIEHVQRWQMDVCSTFIMPAGYPADLRDARAVLQAATDRADRLAAEVEQLSGEVARAEQERARYVTAMEMQAKAYNAALADNRAEAERAGWIAGRDAVIKVADASAETNKGLATDGIISNSDALLCVRTSRQIANDGRALTPPTPEPRT